MTQTSIARSLGELNAATLSWRQNNETIALVPTMGALHEGHLDLVRLARQKAARVITTIFVNPTQFAPHEDLDRYPRQETRDVELLKDVGCDLVFAPAAAEMYPTGFGTTIMVSKVSEPLEGQFRPHFFAGVATIVAKLLNQTAPSIAVFGEKDWQQLQVIKAMVRDLDLKVTIIGAPTRREADGLAMSSRNAYLSHQERAAAPALKLALDQICQAAQNTPENLDAVCNDAKHSLVAKGFGPIDYLEARHASTLEPWTPGAPLRVLAAAWLGKTRLIDNCGVEGWGRVPSPDFG